MSVAEELHAALAGRYRIERELGVGGMASVHLAEDLIFALGAVTYEMLAGEPPFTGPTAQAILVRVMTSEPPSLVAQRKSVPPHVEAAVAHALEKLPADRFATAPDFARALAGEGAGPGVQRSRHATTPLAAKPARATLPTRARQWAPWAVAAVALLALATALWRAGRAPAAPPVRLALPLPPDQQLSPFALGGGARPLVVFSPDGQAHAYIATAGMGQQSTIVVLNWREELRRKLAAAPQ